MQGPEYVVEFFKVLPRDLKLGIQTGDERTKDKARAFPTDYKLADAIVMFLLTHRYCKARMGFLWPYIGRSISQNMQYFLCFARPVTVSSFKQSSMKHTGL